MNKIIKYVALIATLFLLFSCGEKDYTTIYKKPVRGEIVETAVEYLDTLHFKFTGNSESFIYDNFKVRYNEREGYLWITTDSSFTTRNKSHLFQYLKTDTCSMTTVVDHFKAISFEENEYPINRYFSISIMFSFDEITGIYMEDNNCEISLTTLFLKENIQEYDYHCITGAAGTE